MIAREHGQATKSGKLLNELGDVLPTPSSTCR